MFSGIISGTNSFAGSDLKLFNALDGMALGMSIGGIEMLSYVLIISATANIGIYNYNSLLQRKGDKIKGLRDIRLSLQEIACILLAVFLIVFAAYRESVM